MTDDLNLSDAILGKNTELKGLELPELKALNRNIKVMDIAEFRKFGYLQELNRLFLHPLGLTLAVSVDDDGSEKLSHIGDYRLEGIKFDDALMETKEFKERINNVRREAVIRGYIDMYE